MEAEQDGFWCVGDKAIGSTGRRAIGWLFISCVNGCLGGYEYKVLSEDRSWAIANVSIQLGVEDRYVSGMRRMTGRGGGGEGFVTERGDEKFVMR